MKHQLWTDQTRSRYFLIPENEQLTRGEFMIYTMNGEKKQVDLTSITIWEISPEEASKYLQADLNQVLENAKNAFSNVMLFTAQNPQNDAQLDLIFSVLNVDPQQLQSQPEIAKEAVNNLYTELKEKLVKCQLQDSEMLVKNQADINSLQSMLKSEGIDISDAMDELTNQLQAALSSEYIQENLPMIKADFRKILAEMEKNPETLAQKIDEMIKFLSEEIFIDQEQKLEQQRQQEYKQSAQQAIAESFKSLGIPSFAGGDLQLDPNELK